MNNLQAVIICGGVGARMGDLTNSTPKSLLIFEDKPILSHILDRVSIAFGRTGEVILATGFGSEQIKNQYGLSYQGLTLRYAHDERQIGTRNRLLLVKNMISGPFLFLDGDIICEPRLYCEVVETHYQKLSVIATIGLAIDHRPAPGHGVATVDQEHYVTGLWYPPITRSDLTYYREIHVCVFTPQLLEFLLSSNVTEISKGLMFAIQSGQKLRGKIYDGAWAHFVYPNDLIEQKLPPCQDVSMKLLKDMAAAGQTDASTLSARAYKDDRLLAKRKALYKYTEPHYETSNEASTLLNATANMTVLDAGCGSGDLILRAVEQQSGVTFIGVDVSTGIFRLSQKTAALKHLPAYFLQGDIQQLDFDSGTFDRVLALHMLYHVPDMNLGVQELRRVLKEDGFSLISLNSIESKPFLRQMKAKAAVILGCEQYPDMTVRLNLENGAELLKKHFGKVETHLYESVITLKNAQPYVDYIDSTREFWYPHPREDAWQIVLQMVKSEVSVIIQRDKEFKEKNIFGILVSSGRP